MSVEMLLKSPLVRRPPVVVEVIPPVQMVSKDWKLALSLGRVQGGSVEEMRSVDLSDVPP